MESNPNNVTLKYRCYLLSLYYNNPLRYFLILMTEIRIQLTLESISQEISNKLKFKKVK